MSSFISKEALLNWLDSIVQAGMTLVAPTQVEEGISLFRPVTRSAEVDLDCPVTVLSPKDWFFPASETMFSVERKDGRLTMQEPETGGQAVLFGLHPCDALGIALMDLPFLAPPQDSLYRQRRERTVLVGLSCVAARPECFCTSMGTGPDDPGHLDLMLTPVAEGYLVKAVTERGQALLKGAELAERDIVPPPPPTLPTLPTEDLPRVARRVFDHKYWSRLADRCLHCNICAYVCSACYCFDIRDYSQGAKVERVRSWESCQAPGFTRIAGGYDPRASKGTKLRQRFYHKFLYFPLAFERLSCTGCGRCVRSCPVNIDIREVITEMHRIGAELASSREERSQK